MSASSRGLTSVRMQVEFAAEHGVSVASLLPGSGIEPEWLTRNDVQIEAEQELAVVANLCAELGDSAELGLAMGQRYHLSSYGVWGFALLSSGTFREAVALGQRYLDLTFAFNRVTLEEQSGQAALVIDDGDLPEGVRDYLLARDASAIMMIQQELFASRMPLSRLQLRLPARATAPFEAVFGLVPEFDQPLNRIGFAAGVLDRPLPQANPVTARLCEQQCQQLLAQRRRRVGMAARVREQLLARPGRFPTMEQLADEIGVTSRTLRRRLLAEDTSYRELLDEVRRLLAEQWLLGGGLRQEEISARLGFSEVSNFIHAFKRWTGKTPARYRREKAMNS